MAMVMAPVLSGRIKVGNTKNKRQHNKAIRGSAHLE